MKIAICQLEIIWENKEKNLAKAENFIEEASRQGASVIFFPEMSLTGFSVKTGNTKEKYFETVNGIKKIAQRYAIAVGIGWVKECGEKLENHYTVIGKEGELYSDYVKIHSFSFVGEDILFRQGENIISFEIENIKISTFICYDLRFPEIFQAVSNEVNIIVVVANWPEKRKEHWKCLLRARAIENQTYIIGVNCCGSQEDTYYSGDSCIINPNGTVLKEMSEGEAVLFFDFPEDVGEYRKQFPMKEDRRNELYQKYYRSE